MCNILREFLKIKYDLISSLFLCDDTQQMLKSWLKILFYINVYENYFTILTELTVFASIFKFKYVYTIIQSSNLYEVLNLGNTTCYESFD